MPIPRLRLEPGCWYGWQMIPGYTGERNVPYFSPILVQRVTPRKTGRGILSLEFWNVQYAEGVQDFHSGLRVLKRASSYLVAEIVYGADEPSDRTAVISQIDFDWIRKFCPTVWINKPPESLRPPVSESVSLFLDATFGRP